MFLVWEESGNNWVNALFRTLWWSSWCCVWTTCGNLRGTSSSQTSTNLWLLFLRRGGILRCFGSIFSPSFYVQASRRKLKLTLQRVLLCGHRGCQSCTTTSIAPIWRWRRWWTLKNGSLDGTTVWRSMARWATMSAQKMYITAVSLKTIYMQIMRFINRFKIQKGDVIFKIKVWLTNTLPWFALNSGNAQFGLKKWDASIHIEFFFFL